MRDGTLAAVDGRLARRRVATGHAAAALRAEVTLLTRLAGLAVPAVIDTSDDGQTVEVLTTYHPPPLALTAGVLGRAAATLAAAHDRAIVHGALTVACVGLAPDSSPIVDGWRGQGTPTDDVAALGALLAAAATTATERALAARATAADPSTRPTMRAISDALAPASSRSLAPSRSLSTRPRTVWASRQRTGAGLLVVAAVVIGCVAAAGVLAPGDDEMPHRPVAAVGRRPLTTNIVEHDGARVRVGVPGDVVIVGDWDCDGATTPALLRPTTATVWEWASWEAAPEARPAAPETTSLRVVRSHGCDRLVEVSATGAPVGQAGARSRSATSLASSRP